MVDQVMAMKAGTRIMVLAPIIAERKGEHLHVFQELRSNGFVRARIDGIVVDLDTTPEHRMLYYGLCEWNSQNPRWLFCCRWK